MKPGRFEYFRPRDLAEALNLKQSYGADASVLAGGQSLIPVLNFRLGRPRAIIDLGSIGELAELSFVDDELRIGAMVRQRTCESHPLVAAHCPLLPLALNHVAHPAVRNRGTIGGTVAHADPSAEIPAVVAGLEGSVVAASPEGTRIIPADEFFAFQLTNTLSENELVVEVRVPGAPANSGSAFHEFGRRHGDFAIAGIGIMLTRGAENDVSRARIGVCGIASTPVRAVSAEQAALEGQANWGAVADAVVALVDAVDEPEASVEYRRDLVRGLTLRVLEDAWTNTQEKT